jgi:hypothetical protein
MAHFAAERWERRSQVGPRSFAIRARTSSERWRSSASRNCPELQRSEASSYWAIGSVSIWWFRAERIAERKSRAAVLKSPRWRARQPSTCSMFGVQRSCRIGESS